LYSFYKTKLPSPKQVFFSLSVAETGPEIELKLRFNSIYAHSKVVSGASFLK
jgi:hypothetical protein